MYRSSCEMVYISDNAVSGGDECGGLWLSNPDRGRFLDRNGREAYKGGKDAINDSPCDSMLACTDVFAES